MLFSKSSGQFIMFNKFIFVFTGENLQKSHWRRDGGKNVLVHISRENPMKLVQLIVESVTKSEINVWAID
jgi:hypothetical protein